MSSMPYPNAESIFYQQYQAVRRDEVVGVLLALFLGCFGVHHFYVGRTGLGILYLCLCWTGIPAILGVIECFFMPGRVRLYNAAQAAAIAAALGIPIPGAMAYPGWVAPGYGPGYAPAYATPYGQAQPVTTDGTTLVACHSCGHANPAGVRFCSGCGSPLT